MGKFKFEDFVEDDLVVYSLFNSILEALESFLDGTTPNADIEISRNFKALTYGTAEVTDAELGYLSGVTDEIQAQINDKQETLASGGNIKSVNGVSILGSGNMVTPNTTYEASNFDIKDLTDSTSLRTTWSAKQKAITVSATEPESPSTGDIWIEIE
jgi:hypothetical protein